MNIVLLTGIFVLGFVLGIGATLLYIQYTMYSQVGKMEEQMEEVMNLEEDLMDLEAGEEKQGEN